MRFYLANYIVHYKSAPPITRDDSPVVGGVDIYSLLNHSVIQLNKLPVNRRCLTFIVVVLINSITSLSCCQLHL